MQNLGRIQRDEYTKVLTASSAMLMQSVSVRETIRGVRHAHKPASVISLHPVNSSSNRT